MPRGRFPHPWQNTASISLDTFLTSTFVTHVEWAGGISPPASHRTVREPLDSYGSYYTASSAKTPQIANNLGSRENGFALLNALLLQLSWRTAQGGVMQPLRSAWFPRFHCYYELLRPYQKTSILSSSTGPLLEVFSPASQGRFLRSLPRPKSRSCHLYTGHRLDQ